jgi:polyphosphate kinase
MPHINLFLSNKFLREAALDPKVTTIKITLYRLAKNSQISSNQCSKNGKKSNSSD